MRPWIAIRSMIPGTNPATGEPTEVLIQETKVRPDLVQAVTITSPLTPVFPDGLMPGFTYALVVHTTSSLILAPYTSQEAAEQARNELMASLDVGRQAWDKLEGELAAPSGTGGVQP